jgi:hypothetical protein
MALVSMRLPTNACLWSDRVNERILVVDEEKEEIFQKGRPKKRTDAKGLFCYRCAIELGLSQTDLARKRDMTVSGIGYAVRSGEILVAGGGYMLIDSVI